MSYSAFDSASILDYITGLKKTQIIDLAEHQLKDRKKRNEEDYPIHSFQTLLDDLGTICLHKVVVCQADFDE